MQGTKFNPIGGSRHKEDAAALKIALGHSEIRVTRLKHELQQAIIDKAELYCSLDAEKTRRLMLEERIQWLSARDSITATVFDKQDEPPSDKCDLRCVICMENKSTFAPSECGHLCMCSSCAKGLVDQIKDPTCPICRIQIKNKLWRVFA
jgi:hypothetical protein